MRSFHVAGDRRHLVWDNGLPPALTLAPGDEVTLEVAESSGGQVGPDSDVAALHRIDFDAVNPCTGPVFVDGLQAGDDLVVTILDITTVGWAWTANVPGFGLLAADFPDPHLWISPIRDGIVSLPIGIDLAARPLIGCLGGPPATPGATPLLAPTNAGGTMNIAQLGAGSRLHLPAQIDGGLLSAGDPHAVQGDGEVCGTGAETSATVTLRVEVARRAAGLNSPWLEHSVRRPETAWVATTGIGPDLFAAAVEATRRAVDLVADRSGLAPVEAYLLLSLVGDLRISEIVDVPNWVVTMHVPAQYVGHS